jgi:sigma-B regulation protein RsbU (phosphoserine phosphatase)
MAGMDGIKYKRNEMQLYPGDQILLYTDGVTEATNVNQKLYGEERLIKFLNKNNDTNPKNICNKIKEDVDKFVGEAPQFDDITLLALNLKCIRSDTYVIVNLNKEAINVVNEFAEKIIQKLETVPKIANKINIIIDEIYSNIINYSKANLLKISYVIENGQISLIFVDDGDLYNPLENEDPDINLSAEERDIGGLGIFMVKKLAQSVEYKYEDDKNILKVVISIY